MARSVAPNSFKKGIWASQKRKLLIIRKSVFGLTKFATLGILFHPIPRMAARGNILRYCLLLSFPILVNNNSYDYYYYTSNIPSLIPKGGLLLFLVFFLNGVCFDFGYVCL